MTDISESGIEPCPHGHEQRSLGMVVVPVAEGNAPRWYVRCMDCSATGPRAGTRETAIEAWNRRHPPASREEGLIDALTKVRDAILSPINSLAIVDTVWMPVPGATYSIETLVDFIDAQIALIPTKPEAKESGE